MLDRVKDGSPYLVYKRHTLDQELLGRTWLWAEHMHTPISDQYIGGGVGGLDSWILYMYTNWKGFFCLQVDGL